MSASITFVKALPGLEPFTDFTLTAVDGAEGLYSLVPDGVEGLKLFALDAAIHLPTYQPEITLEQSNLIGVFTPDEISVLVIVNPANAETTVNLAAPIIFRPMTGQAAQVIIEKPEWPVRAPLSALA